MDKYQRVVLENNKKDSFYYCVSVKNGGGAPNTNFNYSTDVFTLTQDEDIFSTKYTFVLRANTNIETCSFYVNGEWHSANQKGTSFCIELDFENRVEKVKLIFADNIVDDYVFIVEYVEADKDLYYQKQVELQRRTYIEAAQIKHSIGAHLVNIYFQPCCTDCCKTEIELWIAKGRRENHHGMIAYIPKLISAKPEQIIAKFSVGEGFFFKSISGLANGVYVYRVRQYKNNCELLFESDFKFFEIGS